MENTSQNYQPQNAFWKRGEPMVWLSGIALSLTLILCLVFVGVIIANGVGIFWPSTVIQFELKDGKQALGEITQKDTSLQKEKEVSQIQIKVGNRKINGLDFQWVNESDILSTSIPKDVVVLERLEYGLFYGFLKSVHTPDTVVLNAHSPEERWNLVHKKITDFQESIDDIHDEISDKSHDKQSLVHDIKKLEYEDTSAKDPELTALYAEVAAIDKDIQQDIEKQQKLLDQAHSYKVELQTVQGHTIQIGAMDIVRLYYPNRMSASQKIRFYITKMVELVTEEPREANTEGGIFPAIFGTVTMVFLMSIFSFPLGVIAAIYLREYATDGILVRSIQIAVNNLAGIPSIVYGVFGLGFFVYEIGGTIDQLFFPELLPTPTFGTGGVLWASLTLALLTVPVVIVSTEEALSSIPSGMREGSYALGATQLQTLLKVVLPMASPGIMTGFILAMARAAGEVAPLMITGVVKLAPSLPVDLNYPFIHLERKFMHLGFHIYDLGFQSPNIEAAKPMVFVTTLLLILIVLLMSSISIYLRYKMRKRYTIKSF